MNTKELKREIKQILAAESVASKVKDSEDNVIYWPQDNERLVNRLAHLVYRNHKNKK